MRIVESRYEGELRSFELALRFVQYEARTSTIRAFTGLTADRIRKFGRRYGGSAKRHRGKSPQQAGYFMHSGCVRREASLLGSLLHSCGLLPDEPSAQAVAALPNLHNGLLLCDTYAYYLSAVYRPALSFEHAIFLARCLAGGEQLRLIRCTACGIGIVAERFPERAHWCEHCRPTGRGRLA